MRQVVLIYVSRRQRGRLVRDGVDVLVEYDDYVLARVTGEQRAELARHGFEVETYRAEPPVAAQAASHEGQAPGPRPAAFGPGAHYYQVEFVGPIKPEWLQEIAAHGGVLQEPLPPAAYVVALDDAAFEWLVRQTQYVRAVVHYGAEKRISPGLLDAIHDDPLVSRGAVRGEPEPRLPRGAERIPTAFTVRFFQADDLQAALPRLREIGATPGEPRPEGNVLVVNFEPGLSDMRSRVEQVAALHGVRSVEPYVLRQLRNDVAAGLMNAEEVQRPSGLGLSGRGEIVGVADSGLDTGDPETLHPDFAGRIAAILSWPVASDWATLVENVGQDDGPADARSGHGTHVTGSLVGDGRVALASQGVAVRGLAYGATLVFQAIEQHLAWTRAYREEYRRRYGRLPPDYGLAGLPADLKVLFDQAYERGVRIHSNSWGGGLFGGYDDYAEAVDRFCWEHKDFLPFFAAGNDGADYDQDGRVDAGSVTPPGTAKNCVTVGAAESVRAEGGYQEPYGVFLDGSFPVAPLSDDRPSDNADDIAAFSSRGPAQDGRIKPDVVAPGTNILSTRSSAIQGQDGWGAWTGSDRYMFNGGTSMATPLAAGAAALIREYLRTARRRLRPSAALVKATLLHGARRRPYRYGETDERLWDCDQGWGHLDLAAALAPAPPAVVRWYDQRRGLNTGQSWRWSCRVRDASTALAITLVWTDYPGAPSKYPNLINDLDLVVTDPSGRIHYGNARAEGDAPDRTNNVERIVIARPEPGRYGIRIRAFNVPAGPQDFALVYSGALV